MNLVVINEQHTLLPDQKRVLDERFGKDCWSLHKVPAEGWTLEEQKRQASLLLNNANFGEAIETVVFASPVPALLVILARAGKINTLVFHNDRRIAKEVPDGKGGVKVIHTVAPDGWVLV